MRWYAAPAKLNLFLHITSQRPDGYHNLETYFQLVGLRDELAFEPLGQAAIERAAPDDAALAAIDPEQDLCVRAARALQQAAGVRRGVRIHLRKRIPLGGGLGGGSSDAATTLRALDRLWECGLGVPALAQIGLALGADVPVFVRGESAWGSGVGEELRPEAAPPATYLIIHPGVSVRTADVFQAPELTRNSPLLTIRALSDPALKNDCEPVVRARYPAVADALDWLARFAPARLTGTGACIFARFDSAAAAERVAGRVPDRWRAWVVPGLARSPLLGQLEAV